MNLPLLLSIVAMSISSGAIVSMMGYYVPFMIASAVLVAIGSGLLYTLRVDSGHPMWIGYQIIAGFGVGLGIQQSNMAAQTVLPFNDIPVGTGIMMFAQSVGGGLTVAIAQAVFQNTLISKLKTCVPELPNPVAVVLNVGATDLNSFVSQISQGSLMDQVLAIYNNAIIQTFLLSAIMGSLAIVPALGMKWVSMKKETMAERPDHTQMARQQK